MRRRRQQIERRAAQARLAPSRDEHTVEHGFETVRDVPVNIDTYLFVLNTSWAGLNSVRRI